MKTNDFVYNRVGRRRRGVDSLPLDARVQDERSSTEVYAESSLGTVYFTIAVAGVSVLNVVRAHPHAELEVVP